MIASYLFAASAALAVLSAVLWINRRITARSEVGQRLDLYAASQVEVVEAGERRSGVSDRLNAFLNGRSFATATAAKLARAGVKLKVSEYVLIKLAAALLPMSILLLVTGNFLVALPFGALCFLLPDMWLRRREARRHDQFAMQLPDTLSMISNGIRAGFSLQHALINVAEQAPEPTASEFNRVNQEMRFGVPLVEALDSLVERVKSDDLEMIASVFQIHSRVGGNLAEVLETVGATIRERVKLRRDVQVITSMQRMSAYILGGLPLFTGLMILLINPSYMLEMFQLNIFLCIPILAFTLTVLGFLVIRKMSDIKI